MRQEEDAPSKASGLGETPCSTNIIKKYFTNKTKEKNVKKNLINLFLFTSVLLFGMLRRRVSTISKVDAVD